MHALSNTSSMVEMHTSSLQMDSCHNQANQVKQSCSGHKITMQPNHRLTLFDVFDLRMFYVRARNFKVDESTPQYLTLIHIPLTPETILEVNGKRSSSYSNYASSLLRRDRVDKRSEEVTFVSIDRIKMTGSVRFEVYDEDYLLLAGALELFNGDSLTGETKYHGNKCSMKFQSILPAGTGFLKTKQSAESKVSMVEVFVAGCLFGKPIILSKTLRLGFSKKQQLKVALDTIPEDETTATDEVFSEDNFQLYKFQMHDSKPDFDGDHEATYSKAAYFEGEGEELSWFNAGVRVGVGVGLGICLGVGLGVGLLIRTYQASTRSFKGRFV